MTPDQRSQLRKMEAWGRTLGHAVDDVGKEQFGKKMGFVIFVFEFGDSKLSTYLSNGHREDCVKALRELLAHIEAKGFTGTTEANN